MLKKLRNLALIFACMSLIFAGVSCSSSDDDDDDGKTTEQESGPDTGGNNGDGNNGGGNTGSGGGSGSGSTGSGSGSGSTEEKSPYVGTWTGNVTIEGQACSLSATLNDDETLVAYLSMEGFTDGTWSETDSGVSLTIGKETVPGKLNNGNLVVNYGQDIPLTKVDTAAYIGTWKGTLGGATLSITLNADGTMSGYSPIMDPTNIDGFWTVTNDGVIIGAGEENVSGTLQGDKLVINFNGMSITLTKDSSGSGSGSGSSSTEEQTSYEGTWTVTMEDQVLSITLNTDETCVAYNSDEGFAEAIWNVTNSGVTITIPGEGSLSGRLDNGNLVVNYGQDVPLTKVDTAAYVGTWEGSSISITLNADGTMSGYSPVMNPNNIDGFWTVTNDGVMIGAEGEIIQGSLQGDKLEVTIDDMPITLTRE